MVYIPIIAAIAVTLPVVLHSAEKHPSPPQKVRFRWRQADGDGDKGAGVVTSWHLRLAAVAAAMFAALLLALSPLTDSAFAAGNVQREAGKAGPAVNKTSRSSTSAEKRAVERQKPRIRADRPAKPLVSAKKDAAVRKSGTKGARSSKRFRGGGAGAAKRQVTAASKARPGKKAAVSVGASAGQSSASASASMTASSKRARETAYASASISKRKKTRSAHISKRRPAPLVLIDPGHGGHDPGAMAGGLVEKNVTLSVARKLAKRLATAGYRVRLTRSSDRTVSPLARLRMASRLKPSLFISLHCNSAPSSRERGLETFAYLPERRHEGRGSVVPIEEVGMSSESSVQAKSIHDRLTSAVRKRGSRTTACAWGDSPCFLPSPGRRCSSRWVT